MIMRRSFDRLRRKWSKNIWNRIPNRDICISFFNRRGDCVKMLLWEGDGFVIWYKRLEAWTSRRADSGGKPANGSEMPDGA